MEDKIISYHQGSFEYEELQVQETNRKDFNTEVEVIFSNIEIKHETYEQEIEVKIIRFQDKLIVGNFKTVFLLRTVGKLNLKVFHTSIEQYVYFTSFALAQARGAFKALCDKNGLYIDIKQIPTHSPKEIKEHILSGYYVWNN